MRRVPEPLILRPLLDRIPRSWKRRLASVLESVGLKLADRPRLAATPIARLRLGPIVISGFFSDSRGVAQSARLSATALSAAGFEVLTHDISYLLEGGAPTPGPVVEGGVWLIHANPPEADPILRLHPELSGRPLFRIGYWVWELPKAPQTWLDLAPNFHTLWTPSQFSADSFVGTDAPIWVMPHPVAVTPKVEASMGVVTLGSFADLRSSAARKNPLGAVTAFIRAFPQPGPQEFILKLSGVEADPSAYAEIAQLAGGRTDIQIVTKRLDDSELAALHRRIDIMVSLHRAEGFGLPLAEAMGGGKAVIATAWSGNLDFMPQMDVQRVPVTEVVVNDASGLYLGQTWAEPNLSFAAASMRLLVEDADLRHLCGRTNLEAVSAIHARWNRAVLDAQEFARFAIDA